MEPTLSLLDNSLLFIAVGTFLLSSFKSGVSMKETSTVGN
jgi:hypothetical protein